MNFKKNTLIIFILSILLALSIGFIIGVFSPLHNPNTSTVTENSNSNNSEQQSPNTVPTEKASTAKSTENIPTDNTESTEKFNGYKAYGALSVKDGKLVSSNGQPAILHGISTHGINWFPQYVSSDTFKTLKENYGINVIRLAMYTSEYNGYCTGDENNKQTLKNTISEGINHATNLGMYVIVDWHTLTDNNPLQNKEEAKKFFDEISRQYKDSDNIIYEICNEPVNTSWQDVKQYAEEIIPIIRSNDKNAIILVGTPNWCQYLNEAAASPLDYDNVMYTLHFYAATHKDDLRNTLKNVVAQKLPVFVSEFGITEASGNGNIDINSANSWIDLLEQNQISYVLWNLSNKNEACSFLKPDCQKISDFTDSDLSEEGKWYVDKLSQTK